MCSQFSINMFYDRNCIFSLKQNRPDKKHALMCACLAEHDCNNVALHLLQFVEVDSVIGSNLNIMFTNSSVEKQYFHSNK